MQVRHGVRSRNTRCGTRMGARNKSVILAGRGKATADAAFYIGIAIGTIRSINVSINFLDPVLCV